MLRRLVLGMLCSALAVPASANAAQISLTPPAAPVPEDAAFALAVAGNSDPGEYQNAYVRIRPAGGVPCAAKPADDAGTSIESEGLGQQGGPFTLTPTYTPENAGTYLVCAWVTGSSSGDVRTGPVSTTVAVRVPNLALTINARTAIRPEATLAVSLNFTAEVERRLIVAFAQAGDCGVNSRALDDASANYVSVYSDRVSGTGSAQRTVTVPSATGTYRLCGYYHADVYSGGGDAPQAVIPGPVVNVSIPTLRCAKVGGRRGITQVRATGPSCGAARSVARRWGAPRKAPRFVGDYTCKRGAKRSVTCRSSTRGKVTFRYRR